MKTESNVRIDVRRNRIYLTMIGFHDVAEATRMADAYIDAMKQCEPGFSVLVDVSQYKPGSAAIEPMATAWSSMAEKYRRRGRWR